MFAIKFTALSSQRYKCTQPVFHKRKRFTYRCQNPILRLLTIRHGISPAFDLYLTWVITTSTNAERVLCLPVYACTYLHTCIYGNIHLLTHIHVYRATVCSYNLYIINIRLREILLENLSSIIRRNSCTNGRVC